MNKIIKVKNGGKVGVVPFTSFYNDNGDCISVYKASGCQTKLFAVLKKCNDDYHTLCNCEYEEVKPIATDYQKLYIKGEVYKTSFSAINDLMKNTPFVISIESSINGTTTFDSNDFKTPRELSAEISKHLWKTKSTVKSLETRDFIKIVRFSKTLVILNSEYENIKIMKKRSV